VEQVTLCTIVSDDLAFSMFCAQPFENVIHTVTVHIWKIQKILLPICVQRSEFFAKLYMVVNTVNTPPPPQTVAKGQSHSIGTDF
jgi:hypothetical protein